MAKRVQSDSGVQREIETLMLEKIKLLLKDDSLKSTRVPLDADETSYIHPDFFSEESKIIGEIHAHIGRLKGSQPGKIARDILKMNLLEETRKCKFRKYIAVCNEEEYKQLTEGDSFLKIAIETYDVKILLINDLNASVIERLEASMKRQNLIKS